MRLKNLIEQGKYLLIEPLTLKVASEGLIVATMRFITNKTGEDMVQTIIQSVLFLDMLRQVFVAARRTIVTDHNIDQGKN